MPLTEKLKFLKQFAARGSQERITDIEVREIIKLKFSEKPFSTYTIFTMIHLDQETYKSSQIQERKGKSYEKQQAIAQIKKLFQFINHNFIHLQYILERIDSEDFMKLRYEYYDYEYFVITNTQNLLKLSKNKD